MIWEYGSSMYDHMTGLMIGELRQREVGTIMPPRLEFIVGVALATKCAVPHMLNKILRHADLLKKGEQLCVRMVESGALAHGIVDPKFNDSPLWHAARLGANLLCKSLIDHGAQWGVGINDATSFNETALHFAAAGEHLETCRTLLQLGADASICGSRDLPNLSPLHEAAMVANPALIELFLKQPGSMPQQRAYWNRTALHLVAIAAHPELICEVTRPLAHYQQCVELLLAAGVPVDAQGLCCAVEC